MVNLTYKTHLSGKYGDSSLDIYWLVRQVKFSQGI